MASLLFFLFLLCPAARTRYLSGGPEETQLTAGVIPMDGVSPVPTEPPGLNGVLKELRKRDSPQSLCGLIDGDPREFWASIKFFHPVSNSDIFKKRVLWLARHLPHVWWQAIYTSHAAQFPTRTSALIPIYQQHALTMIFIDWIQVSALWRLHGKNSSYLLRIVVWFSLSFSSSSANPYCNSLITYGLIPQFFCAATSYPRIHSFVPIAAYYSSLSATSSIILPNTSPAKTTATAITPDDSDSRHKAKSRLPSPQKLGLVAPLAWSR